MNQLLLIQLILAFAVCVGTSQTPLAMAQNEFSSADTPIGGAELGDIGPGEQPYFDLDAYLDGGSPHAGDGQEWCFRLLPDNLIYKSYLAGMKESRLGLQTFWRKNDGWLWDATLGGRVGLLRYGDNVPVFPQGIQVDVEGAAQLRLDPSENVDFRSVDFRAGIPVTFGYGRHQTKIAYYHMSSHLGDEFLLKNPGYRRLNWSRDAFVLGQSIYLADSLRLYGEMGWAFHSDVSEPWEFQFGAEWAPVVPTGLHGAPFFAINTHLRQEVDYGGNFVLQAGWSWLSDEDRRLLRIGLHYYNGKSDQYSFFNDFESQIGFGIWYDF